MVTISDITGLLSVRLYEEYGTSVTSEEDLTERVHGAIESLTRQLHLLGHLCEAQHRLVRLCNNVGGIQFEPRL